MTINLIAIVTESGATFYVPADGGIETMMTLSEQGYAFTVRALTDAERADYAAAYAACA